MSSVLHLYHSFPRQPKRHWQNELDEDTIDNIGIRTLESIKRNGIVLTPESLFIPANPKSVRDIPAEGEVTQIRACFTLLERPDLFAPRQLSTTGQAGAWSSHAEMFGHFSIGLHPIRSRELGVVPVMYFYSGLSEEVTGEWTPSVTQELLFRLREMRTLFCALAHLEAIGSLPDREIVALEHLKATGLGLDFEDELYKKLSVIDGSLARRLVSVVDTDRVPAWNLADWIELLLNFFQVADSKTEAESLEFYQQREWRLVRMSHPDLRCFPLDSASIWRDERDEERLRETVKVLRVHNSSYFTLKRVNASWLLVGSRRCPFFDYVEEVIVPARVAGRVAEILDGEWNLYFETPALHANGRLEYAVFERLDTGHAEVV